MITIGFVLDHSESTLQVSVIKFYFFFYYGHNFPSKHRFNFPILAPILNKFDGVDIKRWILFPPSSSLPKKIMFLLIFKERSS